MIVLHSLQETFEARASEWALTGMMLSLSVLFFVNESLFTRDSFVGMRQILDNQSAWGAIFAVVGLLRLAVLYVNGRYWRTPHYRLAGAFLAGGVWFLLFITFVRNGSVLAVMTPWIFFLDGYNCVRCSKEVGKSEFWQRVSKPQGTRRSELVSQ